MGIDGRESRWETEREREEAMGRSGWETATVRAVDGRDGGRESR